MQYRQLKNVVHCPFEYIEQVVNTGMSGSMTW